MKTKIRNVAPTEQNRKLDLPVRQPVPWAVLPLHEMAVATWHLKRKGSINGEG
jgi:hypothetical protein